MALRRNGYNKCHLLNSITYNNTSDVTPTASVTYGYDEAGNRTSMSDGLGNSTYHFDSLSRMEWEERNFTELATTYRLSYSYNLAGQVKSVTDQRFGTSVNYVYDKTGRSTEVSGSGFPGVSQFASDLKHLAIF